MSASIPVACIVVRPWDMVLSACSSISSTFSTKNNYKVQ